jgi:hypothetical protein
VCRTIEADQSTEMGEAALRRQDTPRGEIWGCYGKAAARQGLAFVERGQALVRCLQ